MKNFSKTKEKIRLKTGTKIETDANWFLKKGRPAM